VDGLPQGDLFLLVADDGGLGPRRGRLRRAGFLTVDPFGRPVC
jgi:hypothetical protein